MTGAHVHPAAPGATARSMRRVVVGMLCLLALALVVVWTLLQLQLGHLDTLVGYSEDNASWAVHELEAEQQRLEIALRDARNGSPRALQEAALRYETFASRQDVLANGVFRRKLRELPAYGALAAEFQRFLATHDGMVADGLQPGEVDALLAGAAAMRGPTHELVLAENAMLNDIQADNRAHIASVQRISMATLVVLGIVTVCFAGYAVAALRRAQASELALAQSEHVLRDALKAAESANAAKSSFLANMSHELRTPLNAVIGFSEFLELSASGQLDERQRGYLGDIRDSGRYLLEIISSILELSKLEAGKIELEIEQVGARELIESCIRMLEPHAAARGIAIEASGLDGLPAIQGDHVRLRQIFTNLLSNAIKYSSEGSHVRVRCGTEGGLVAVRVEDEGIGMRSADIETALRPFERIRNAETANQEGVGLGLTIVKTLVDIHGGRLDIASEIGRGTIVSVRLPAGPPHRAASGADASPPAAFDAAPADRRQSAAG